VVAQELQGSAALLLPDAPRAGLNAALRHGAATVRRLDNHAGVAALSADLPSLRPDELARALDAAAGHALAFVGDADGTGTTMLSAGPGHALPPAFGPASRSAHRASGAYEVELPDVPSLRRDVDTPEDLQEAVRLGVGARTRAVIAQLEIAG
jgi:2-phospho-L-lactate guanylyltransferase